LIGVITGGQVETRTVALLERMAVLWRSLVLPGLVADPEHLAALNRLVDEQARAGAAPVGAGDDQAHGVAPNASAEAPAGEWPDGRTLETAG
jgi:hypothetical protein